MSMQIKYSPGELKKEKRPLIIFGASVTGEALLHWCNREKLSVAGFCDNNSKKAGNVLNGKIVFHPPEAFAAFPDAAVLIAVIDIGDIVAQLEKIGIETVYAASEILRDLPIYEYEYSKSADFVNYVAGNCISSHDSYLFPKKLFLRSVDIVITQRCSLRCRDCSNLMQFYLHPHDYDTESVVETAKTLCRAADKVNELRIIGGEPFMNRNCRAITEGLGEISNVGKLVFFTNATIAPDWNGFTDELKTKMLFIITDYGPLSRNLAAMTAMLAREKIAFLVTKAGNWTSCSAIARYERSETMMQDTFDNCCAKNLFTLMDGALYRCPYAANCYSLGLSEKNQHDRVMINDRKNLKDDLLQFVRQQKYTPVCSWCPGRRFDDPEIEPAIQLKQPLATPWSK